MKTWLAIFTFALLICNQAHAADVDYAYYGMGGMIQTGCYGAAKSAFHLEDGEKWKARLFCGVFSSTVVLFTAARDESAKKGNVVGYGAAGIASSILLTYGFEF